MLEFCQICLAMAVGGGSVPPLHISQNFSLLLQIALPMAASHGLRPDHRIGGGADLADRQVRFFFRYLQRKSARNRKLTAVRVKCRISER